MILSPKYLLLIFIIIAATFSSCHNDGKGNNIDIVWVEKSDGLDDYRLDSEPILHQGFLYVSGMRFTDYRPVLVKFNQKNGKKVGVWDTGMRAGLDKSKQYFYGDHSFFVRREEALTSINLTTMQTDWEVSFDAFIEERFARLENKIYILEYKSPSINIYEINLNNQQKRFVLATTQTDSGMFAVISLPAAYLTAAKDTALCLVSQRGKEIRLINYNVTRKDTIYDLKVDGFTKSPIKNLHIQNENLYIYSNDTIQCLNLSDGKHKWYRNMEPDMNIEDPYFSDRYIFYPSLRLYCIDAQTSKQYWSVPKDWAGLMWGSSANMELVDQILFFNGFPVRVESGEIVESWNGRDSWDESTLPFGGTPAYDRDKEYLYFFTNNRMFCTKLPE